MTPLALIPSVAPPFLSQITLAVLVFHDDVTWLKLLGLFVAIQGGILYKVARGKPNPRNDDERASKDERWVTPPHGSDTYNTCGRLVCARWRWLYFEDHRPGYIFLSVCLCQALWLKGILLSTRAHHTKLCRRRASAKRVGLLIIVR